MENLPHHPLIEISADDVSKAREFYGINDVNRIKESLDAIDEWCKKQDHLSEACKALNRNILERILILSRGSVEATKIKIDKMFTSRAMMPELCMNRSVEEFEPLWDYGLYVPLPKLYKMDQSRVMVTQFLSEKLEQFSLLSYFRYAFMIGEYRLHYDYCLSERYIIDLSNIHIGLLTKVNPILVKKAEVLCTEGFGTKIKGIHLLNAPSFVDRIVFLIKQGLKEKVASRLHVHNSYADLHKHIPKEILPKDYEGDGPSISKLAEQWKEMLRTEEARQIIKDSDKLVADESRRNTSKFNEEYLGMPGSFRKLNVD
ncbi:uncharacterized protein LOC123700507 [Colias croceus]|uniref:uncharacterized protein LOC123700507 n=1 Tax=Colias crocea TaxID=72248 RepID=UPI001E27AA3B|nr:uncharacterized protein LOC123700507 [Colias croceus]